MKKNLSKKKITLSRETVQRLQECKLIHPAGGVVSLHYWCNDTATGLEYGGGCPC